MLEIAICDDNNNINIKIEELITRYLKKEKIDFSIKTFTKATELLLTDCSKYDIVFLDVEIGNYNGIELAKELNLRNENIIIVYISSYVQYAPYGYNVKAVAYILKENLLDMFDSTIYKILYEMKFRDSVFEFVNDKVVTTLYLKNIICFETFNKIIEITTVDKKYSFRGRLSDVEKEVIHKGFVKAHKSYLINIDHIETMKNYVIKLTNSKEMYVSQKRWKYVLKTYLEWKSRI